MQSGHMQRGGAGRGLRAVVGARLNQNVLCPLLHTLVPLVQGAAFLSIT